MPKLIKKKTKKAPRKRKFEMGMWMTQRGVPLTRASNTKTESEFWSFILSALRKATRFWQPATDKKLEGRRPSQSSNKKLKWEFHCEGCGGWFPESEIQLDHIIPIGGLNGPDKVVPWIEKAFVEKDGFQRLCKDKCHAAKTAKEREERN